MGMFLNERNAKQLIDFANIQIESKTGGATMHPTDVDGVIEWKNKCYIFIEYKYGDAQIPLGQKLVYERLCNDINKPCIALLASHITPAGQNVDGGNAIVKQYYWRGEWINANKDITVSQFVDTFINEVER